jgi:hypothetical protein
VTVGTAAKVAMLTVARAVTSAQPVNRRTRGLPSAGAIWGEPSGCLIIKG